MHRGDNNNRALTACMLGPEGAVLASQRARTHFRDCAAKNELREGKGLGLRLLGLMLRVL